MYAQHTHTNTNSSIKWLLVGWACYTLHILGSLKGPFADLYYRLLYCNYYLRKAEEKNKEKKNPMKKKSKSEINQ